MFEELIALLFYSRDYAHRAHLATTSHTHHQVLDEFYKGLVELVDRLVETYQGRNGLITIAYLDAQDDTATPLVVLETHLKIIENMRYRALDKADSASQSQVDDLVNLYLSTLYKLRMR